MVRAASLALLACARLISVDSSHKAHHKGKKKGEKTDAIVYRPSTMHPSVAEDGYNSVVGADLSNLAGRNDKRTQIPFWLVAGAYRCPRLERERGRA